MYSVVLQVQFNFGSSLETYLETETHAIESIRLLQVKTIRATNKNVLISVFFQLSYCIHRTLNDYNDYNYNLTYNLCKECLRSELRNGLDLIFT